MAPYPNNLATLMQYVRKTKYADENYSKDEVYYFF